MILFIFTTVVSVNIECMKYKFWSLNNSRIKGQESLLENPNVNDVSSNQNMMDPRMEETQHIN